MQTSDVSVYKFYTAYVWNGFSYINHWLNMQRDVLSHPQAIHHLTGVQFLNNNKPGINTNTNIMLPLVTPPHDDRIPFPSKYGTISSYQNIIHHFQAKFWLAVNLRISTKSIVFFFSGIDAVWQWRSCQDCFDLLQDGAMAIIPIWEIKRSRIDERIKRQQIINKVGRDI